MAYAFDIDKIQDFFEHLCEQHVDVAHNVNGVKSFARFQSETQVKELTKNAGKNIVVVGSIGGRRTGHKDDRILQREVVLRFASYAEKNGNVDQAKKDAIKKAEDIMFAFMVKMERQQEIDLDDDLPCGVMHFLQPENFSWEEIEDAPWLVNHYGWDLVVPFKVYMPKYDATRWIAPPAPEQEPE